MESRNSVSTPRDEMQQLAMAMITAGLATPKEADKARAEAARRKAEEVTAWRAHRAFQEAEEALGKTAPREAK